jgi:hypothetical protein
MKPLFLLTLIIFGFAAHADNKPRKTFAAPIANAGPDQTIYLTQTSSVTLDGSASSGSSYQWTEISTDYSSGATITSPNSAITTVTGLPQGVFYFQLAVSSGGSTSTDVVVVNVDYDLPPANSTLVTHAIWSDMAANANLRDDTTSCFSWTNTNHDLAGIAPNQFTMEKDGTLGSSIDAENGKYYSTLVDGHGCSGYGRSELIPARHSEDFIDTNKTYVIEWKGYYPQNLNDYMGYNDEVLTIMQIHGSDPYSPPFGLYARHGMLTMWETEPGTGDNSPTEYKEMIPLSDMYNKCHTIRLILKEGMAGNGNYVKIEIDGVQQYLRNTGRVGSTWNEDWIKGGSMYDYGKVLIDPNNYTRGRRVSLVTESFKVYTINGSVSNIPPTANAGSDKTLTLPTNSVNLSGSGTDADGSISSYQWSEISGPSSASISNSTLASTDVTGLAEGVYQFKLTVTDDKGATGTSTVTITVKTALNQPPTANAGSDQTLTLPTNSVTFSGSGTDADGSISSYQWSEISGPSSASISNSNSASTDVTGLAEGVYQFKLTVTDDKGATGTSTVTITVKAASNIPPTANAGTDQTITLPTNSANLSGSGTDADGSISSYQWSQISGPSTTTINNSSSASTSVVGLSAGVYIFQLKVTDNQGATANSSVEVTVNEAVNLPPIANAGADQAINLPTNSINLSGSGTDADGSISSYQWSQISGPSTATINNSSSASTSVVGLSAGVYAFQLKVIDNQGATASDTIKITVNAANIPPIANAGADQAIILPTNSINLSGSGTDADGSISSYQWSQISGPNSGTINNVNSALVNVTGLINGIYQFELKVTDDKGAIGKDTVKITVSQPANYAPTANAGSNRTINLPLDSIQLKGSGNDVDGTIKSYDWTKISGPSAGTILNADSASTEVTNLVQGVYKFNLQVTDDKGATGTDIVQIRVNAANNIAPTANAGPDQTVALPTNNITLSGSGNDTDGTIVSYNWTKISGPSTGTISNVDSASTNIKNLSEGVYQFELKVTDNKGDTGNDTVTITVNAAPNIPPTADAGSDQTITLPTNSVTLSGSGKDADGSISSIKWSKVTGPSSGIISNSNSAATQVTGLTSGIYKFQLVVTDNRGATAISTVTITVNAAANVSPKAYAGADQSITLPTNSVTFSGSGTDSDGTITAYSWKKTAGPAGEIINNPSSANTKIDGLTQGDYTFELTVTDNQGATANDTIHVKVNPAVNIAPVANAGSDQTIILPTDNTTLRGIGTDSDGTIASYSWTKISGPLGSAISNPNAANTIVSGFGQGIYQFELTVTDNNGAVGKDTVKITVNALNNVTPSANAGPDKTITLPTNIVTLSGSGQDADGTISAYAWTKLSGPTGGIISNPNSATPTVSGLIQGVYQFELKVTDNKGDAGTDTVTITVNVAANIPPTADAGADQTITLPTNSITLSGSPTDADGTIASYEWTKIAGPSTFSIVNSSFAVVTINNLVEGVYKFQLNVMDNNGASAKDTVMVTVLPVKTIANIAPTVNAGPDQIIKLPTDSITLTGIGNDVDGTISAYLWTKISGPASLTMNNANSASVYAYNLTAGVYVFELKVTDNKGATAKDTMQVRVNNAVTSGSNNNNTSGTTTPILAPVAFAGYDTTVVAPIDLLTLNGSGTDKDGSIVSYSWKQISGSVAIITSENSPSVNITNLQEGTYTFELTVTDNKGAQGKDTVNVTVGLGRYAPLTTKLVNIYPNPVHDIATLDINSEKPNTNIGVVVTDMAGRTVYTKQFVSALNKTTQKINLSNLIKGAYTVTVYFDGMKVQAIKVLRL